MRPEQLFPNEGKGMVSERRSLQLQTSLASRFSFGARSVLPLDGVVDVVPDDGDRVVLHITWLLPLNKEGVRVPSHPVRVVVGSEALDRFWAMTMQGRRRAMQRFQRWLRERRAGYVPQQEQSGDPRVTEWTIRSSEFTEL